MGEAETHLQEVVWRQIEDLKEQRNVTWEVAWDDGVGQGTGHHTAQENILFQEAL